MNWYQGKNNVPGSTHDAVATTKATAVHENGSKGNRSRQIGKTSNFARTSQSLLHFFAATSLLLRKISFDMNTQRQEPINS